MLFRHPRYPGSPHGSGGSKGSIKERCVVRGLRAEQESFVFDLILDRNQVKAVDRDGSPPAPQEECMG